MSNRVMQTMTFDEFMEYSLADWCKRKIRQGKSKHEIIRWCNRRFDVNGDLNLKSWATEWQLTDGTELCLKAGTVLGLVEANAALFTLMVLPTLDTGLQLVLTELLGLFSKYDSFVMWRLFWLMDDADVKPDEQNIGLGFGVFASGISEGENMVRDTVPYPVMLSAVEYLLNREVLVVSGEWVQ
jgi:hypothetical protein